MKAARLHEVGKPLHIDEVPVPKVNRGEVLVNVKAAIIDGTNLHLREGRFPVPHLPVTLGNETAGVVAEVGEGVRGFKKGDRVLVSCIINFCLKCHYCLSGNENLCEARGFFGAHADGSFAEYIKVPEINVFPLPSEIPFDEGAVLSDAFATAYHAVWRGKVIPGDSVAIYGVGGVGIGALQIARIYGATHVIAVDINDDKLKLARELGADLTINSRREDPVAQIRKLTEARGADVAFEMVGDKQAMEQTIQSVRLGGRAVIIGLGPATIEVPPFSIIRGELEVTGSWGYRRVDFPVLIEFARLGRMVLSKSISARVTLERVNEGLDLLAKDKNIIGIAVDI